MRPLTSFNFLSFLFLFHGAAALPGGCGGSLGIMDIKSPNFNQLVWTCANINPSSLFQSGQNFLIASYQTADDQACGNKCATWIGAALLMAAIRNYETDICECWEIGDIQTWGLLPATSANTNSTFIDFFDSTPPSAQDWGIFTCPEGSWGVSVPYEWGQPGGGSCSSLTIIPSHPPLGNLGLTGAGMCRDFYTNAQYAISDVHGYITCYDDLAGAKYYFNYSSTDTLWDMEDFLLPPSTTTSTTTKLSTTTSSLVSSMKTSSKSSVKSTSSTKSISKSSAKSTFSTKKTLKPSVKSTSSTKSTSKSSVKSTSSMKSTSRPTSTHTSTHTSTQTSSVKTTSSPKSTSKPTSTSTNKSTTTKYSSSSSSKPSSKSSSKSSTKSN